MIFFKKKSSLALHLSLLTLLAGCASTTGETPSLPKLEQTTNSEVEKPAEQTNTEAVENLDTSAQEKIKKLVEANPLFALLAAELASQRGDIASATIAYTKAAQVLKRADLARRAVEISLNSDNPENSLEAAETWLELAPKDEQAQRTVLLLQLSTNQIDKARPALKTYINNLFQFEREHPGLSTVNPEKLTLEMLLRIPDPEVAWQTGREILGDRPTNADNQTLLSQLAWSTKHLEEAIQYIQRAIDKKPDERRYVFLAQYLEKRDEGPESAIDLLQTQNAAHPKWFASRLYLARLYTQQSDWKNACQQFEELIKLQPTNFPLYSSLGFVMAKLDNRKGAEKSFTTYLKNLPANQRQNETLIYVTLSGLALNERDYSGAIRWLNAAPDAAKNAEIQLRKSQVMEEQGHLRPALRVLEQFEAQNEDDNVRLVMARARLVEKTQDSEQAAKLLDETLATYPEQPDLLYERAMVAERLNDLPTLEQHLRKLIELRPENPHGYNALGYTLADQGIRLDEALELITKAQSLAPTDPYIMDSLGWVYFKMGRYTDAENTLQNALSLRQDEEISIHLLQLFVETQQADKARTFATRVKKRFPRSEKLAPWIERAKNISGPSNPSP